MVVSWVVVIDVLKMRAPKSIPGGQDFCSGVAAVGPGVAHVDNQSDLVGREWVDELTEVLDVHEGIIGVLASVAEIPVVRQVLKQEAYAGPLALSAAASRCAAPSAAEKRCVSVDDSCASTSRPRLTKS